MDFLVSYVLRHPRSSRHTMLDVSIDKEILSPYHYILPDSIAYVYNRSSVANYPIVFANIEL